MQASKKYKLNKEDSLKLLKGAGIAIGGALIVYAAEMLPQIEFGAFTAIAVALGGLLINLARKWLSGKKY